EHDEQRGHGGAALLLGGLGRGLLTLLGGGGGLGGGALLGGAALLGGRLGGLLRGGVLLDGHLEGALDGVAAAGDDAPLDGAGPRGQRLLEGRGGDGSVDA